MIVVVRSGLFGIDDERGEPNADSKQQSETAHDADGSGIHPLCFRCPAASHQVESPLTHKKNRKDRRPHFPYVLRHVPEWHHGYSIGRELALRKGRMH
jgi:hypothetical protein